MITTRVLSTVSVECDRALVGEILCGVARDFCSILAGERFCRLRSGSSTIFGH